MKAVRYSELFSGLKFKPHFEQPPEQVKPLLGTDGRHGKSPWRDEGMSRNHQHKQSVLNHEVRVLDVLPLTYGVNGFDSQRRPTNKGGNINEVARKQSKHSKYRRNRR